MLSQYIRHCNVLVNLQIVLRFNVDFGNEKCDYELYLNVFCLKQSFVRGGICARSVAFGYINRSAARAKGFRLRSRFHLSKIQN